mmetsp:Transcript_12955/g.36409  ORF Transcript_12955/g.36409 Transcript_12955/m.36409 type:complete len:306 (+) Transcript_12955:758-1675(+)
MSTLQGTHLHQEHLDALHIELELLVDLKGLLIQFMLHSNLPNGWAIEVVEAVDVVLDAGLVALDGCNDEQVLQVGVGGEGRVLEHNLLQELDELCLELSCHEGLDAYRHILGVLALREGGAHHLVDELPAVLVVLLQDLAPQLRVLPLHHIAGLQLEQGVVVGALHEGIVAHAALVGHAGEVRVALLAVLAHRQRVVVGVGGEEVLRVVVGVDDDLAEGVVDVHVRGALAHQVLKEWAQQLKAVPGFDLSHERLDRQKAADAEDEVVDEVVWGLAVKEGSDHSGRLAWVHLLHVALDVAQHVVGE